VGGLAEESVGVVEVRADVVDRWVDADERAAARWESTYCTGVSPSPVPKSFRKSMPPSAMCVTGWWSRLRRRWRRLSTVRRRRSGFADR